MKKLVLSLLGAAALATASNAMALDTTDVFMVQLGTGLNGFKPAGVMVFDFDSQAINLGGIGAFPPGTLGTPASGTVFPGSCIYQAEWVNFDPRSWTGTLPLSAQCYVAEQSVHGAVSCINNSMHQVPTIVTAMTDPTMHTDLCDGFDPFSQISQVLTMQLGESPYDLEGVVQFDSMVANHSVYGIIIKW